MKITGKAIAMMMSILLAAAVLSGCSVTNGKTEDLKKTAIDSLSSINFDVDVAAIDIIPDADEFALEYHIVNQDVDCSVKDGVLTLNAKGAKSISINSDDESYIRLYVPEGSEFASIDCEGDVGDIHMESIKADDMSVKTDVGNAKLSDITINETLNVKTDVGNVEVALANSDCSYNIKADIATILINGTEFSGMDLEKSHTSEHGPQVNITTDTGNITFDCK